MPCYCDTPAENDQIEIELRCKNVMYFRAIDSLTLEQIEECEKKELKQFPSGNVNNHLCKLCKILTDEQLKRISAFYYNIKWPHKTLYDWYIQHCKDDKEHNNE